MNIELDPTKLRIILSWGGAAVASDEVGGPTKAEVALYEELQVLFAQSHTHEWVDATQDPSIRIVGAKRCSMCHEWLLTQD